MPVDRAVVERAARQHGVISAHQLAEAGHGRHAIAHRVAKGWLRRVHRGVYLVGPLETPWSRAMAAVLAYGEGALLSHRSAGALWDICAASPGRIHVTIAGRDVRDRDGVRAHSVAHFHPADATTRQGIPVTSPTRTLLDLATKLTQRELNRATNEARVNRLVTDHSLNEQFSRSPTHRGIAALQRATAAEPHFTRSEAERRFLELIRAANLPEPTTNQRLHGHEVDFLWPEHRLIVEVDGYAFHSSRSSFERDRRRDAELSAIGYRVLRITWRQITEGRDATVAMLATALAAQFPSRLLRSSTVSA